MEPTYKPRQYTFTPRNARDISLVKTFFEAMGVEYREAEINTSPLSEATKNMLNDRLEQLRQQPNDLLDFDEVMAEVEADL